MEQIKLFTESGKLASEVMIPIRNPSPGYVNYNDRIYIKKKEGEYHESRGVHVSIVMDP